MNYAQTEFGVKTYTDLNKLIENSDAVFLAVKGNVFHEISSNMHPASLKDKPLVSFMAGVTIQEIQEQFCFSVTVVRAMPSVAIGKDNGVIGHTHTEDKRIIDIFDRLGYAFEVDEKDIEKVTAFSACGLGFAAYILNAFKEAGMNLGFDENISEKIVAKTFENAIEMSDYKDTVTQVATKGGATEEGILYLQEEKIDSIISETIQRAYRKARNSIR